MKDEAFLAAVFAAPDDDGPRLVWADRLLERGDPRGELIRLQCAPQRDAATLAREAELMRLHRAQWEAPLKRARVQVHWSRGFPDTLVGDAADVLSSLAAARDLAPIRALTITSGGAGVLELARSAELRRITELSFPGSDRFPDWTIGDDGARALAESEHATGLRSLSLGPNGLTHVGVAALARARWLLGLKRLSVAGNRVELGPLVRRAAGLTALSVAGALFLDAPFPTPARLSQLSLTQCSLRRGVGAVIARTPSLGSLSALALTHCLLDADDVEHLANGVHYAQLHALKLGENAVHDEGAAALARSPHREALRELDLSFGAIGPRGIAALAASETLVKLEHLNLTGNPLWPESVNALASSRGLPALKELQLSERDVPEPFEVLKRRFARRPGLSVKL